MIRDNIMMSDYCNSLDDSLAEAWRLIQRGVADRRHGFHYPVISTISLEGAPRSRTVIIRASDAKKRNVFFHSDQRSAKIEELQNNPLISSLFYDQHAKLQLRLDGKAKIHSGNALAKKRWDAAQTMSRVCYSIMPSPGDAIEEGKDYISDNTSTITRPEQEVSFSNFAVIEISVYRLEWLYLAFTGHRRARFAWNAQGELSQTWLVP